MMWRARPGARPGPRPGANSLRAGLALVGPCESWPAKRAIGRNRDRPWRRTHVGHAKRATVKAGRVEWRNTQVVQGGSGSAGEADRPVVDFVPRPP